MVRHLLPTAVQEHQEAGPDHHPRHLGPLFRRGSSGNHRSQNPPLLSPGVHTSVDVMPARLGEHQHGDIPGDAYGRALHLSVHADGVYVLQDCYSVMDGKDTRRSGNK